MRSPSQARSQAARETTAMWQGILSGAVVAIIGGLDGGVIFFVALACSSLFGGGQPTPTNEGFFPILTAEFVVLMIVGEWVVIRAMQAAQRKGQGHVAAGLTVGMFALPIMVIGGITLAQIIAGGAFFGIFSRYGVF
jgi:hypothetical protein